MTDPEPGPRRAMSEHPSGAEDQPETADDQAEVPTVTRAAERTPAPQSQPSASPAPQSQPSATPAPQSQPAYPPMQSGSAYQPRGGGGLVSALDLNASVPERLRPGIGEIAPRGLPSTRRKELMRWVTIGAFVLALGVLSGFFAYFYHQLK